MSEAAPAMELLGLDVTRAREMYRIIDENNTGELDIRSFVVGATELCGSAKVLDVEAIKYSVNKGMKSLKDVIMASEMAILESLGGVTCTQFALRRAPGSVPQSSA